MRIEWRWVVAVVALSALVLAPTTATGQDGSAEAAAMPISATPEDAVAAYVDALVAADFEALVAASAVDALAEGYRFEDTVERISAFVLNLRSPTSHPLYVEANRALALADVANGARFIAYGLLAGVDPALPVAPVDRAWADGFVAAVDPARLAGLELVEIGVPEPELMDSVRYRDIAAEQARNEGLDERTERVALLRFEGESYAIGFTLGRIGETWKVVAPMSPLSGLSPLPPIHAITLAEYEELTS